MATLINNLSPEELSKFITDSILTELSKFQEKSKERLPDNIKPHMTRKETAHFFDVTTNCINDWVKRGILNPMKVGQRTYFSKEECVNVMFNQLKKMGE